MIALSIRQPWAWLISTGQKDIENRKWRTKYRGPFLIHASKTIDKEAVASMTECGISLPERFQTGGIVGKAEIVDVVTESNSVWFEGPFGFVLENGTRVPFKPCKGKLNFFEVEDD